MRTTFLLFVTLLGGTINGLSNKIVSPKTTVAITMLMGIYRTDTTKNIPAGNASKPTTNSLSQEDFKRIINQQFGYVLTGQSKNVIGNFASLDLTDTEVNFGGSLVSKKGSVWGIKLSGGVTDSFFEIFSNSKLNSKASVELQHHFLSLGSKSIEYETKSGEAFNNQIKAIRDKSEKTKKEIQAGKPRNDLLIKQADLEKKKLQKTIERDSLNTIATRTSLSIDVARASNAAIEVNALQTQIDSIRQAINDLKSTASLIEEENNRRSIELKALRKEPAISLVGFNFGWWSISYKVSQNSFTLFDEKAAFENQKTDKEFITHEIRLQRSHYKWSDFPGESFYITGGIGISVTDNFNTDLTKKELTEVTQYGSTSGQRSSTTKSNVYTGVYKSDLAGLRLFLDYYHFLFTGNTGAIHIYPEVKYLQDTHPTYNLGFGLLFPFRSTKDDTSILNAELYYNFLDVFNGSNKDNNVFQRNSIGVRFAFPINFKPQTID